VRAIIAASVGVLFGALVGFGVSTYWLTKEYQSFRFMLEDVHLTAPMNIRDRRLEDVAKALAAEIKLQKGADIQCIFSPANLANEMPITFTALNGHGYFAVLALADAYRCHVELVGDRVLLFMRSDQAPASSAGQM
jgi:hypothetical protein